jgi:SAM-dependent methyltransferase
MDDWNNYYRERVSLLDKVSFIPKYMHDLLPSDKKAKIIDVGCGYGGHMKALKSLGYASVFGVEPSEIAAQFGQSAGLNIYCGVLGGELPVGFAPADFVYMLHVLEHIEKDSVIDILAHVRLKILRPGGRLFVAVPNAQSVTNAYWRYEDWTHHTLFTAGSLLYVLRSAGFRDVVIHDPMCLHGVRLRYKIIKYALFKMYSAIYKLKCIAMSAPTHAASPNVFSFEVKALAKS